MTPEEQLKAKQAADAQRKVVTDAIQALQSYDLNTLPEPFRAKFEAIKGQFNAHLATLPPIEMVKQAREAGWTLDSLFQNMTALNELCGQMGAALAGVSVAYQSAGDGKVSSAIEVKVTAGELVPKDKHELALQTARDEGVKEGLARAAKHSARAKQLTDAGLPAPEAVLALDDDGFSRALQSATELKAAADGMKLGDAVMAFPWDFFADEPSRKLQLAAHAAAHAAAVKAVGAAAPAAHAKHSAAPGKAASRPDPFNGGADPAIETKLPRAA